MRRLVDVILVLSLTSWGCGERTAHAADQVNRWKQTAISAGWPASSWPRVRCIMKRESGGNPRAFNRRDPAGGSRGLMQINGIHHGWLTRHGITPGELFNGYLNLRAARLLYKRSQKFTGDGWAPWGSTRKSC